MWLFEKQINKFIAECFCTSNNSSFICSSRLLFNTPPILESPFVVLCFFYSIYPKILPLAPFCLHSANDFCLLAFVHKFVFNIFEYYYQGWDSWAEVSWSCDLIYTYVWSPATPNAALMCMCASWASWVIAATPPKCVKNNSRVSLILANHCHNHFTKYICI